VGVTVFTLHPGEGVATLTGAKINPPVRLHAIGRFMIVPVRRTSSQPHTPALEVARVAFFNQIAEVKAV
jgi:hypothetical protein